MNRSGAGFANRGYTGIDISAKAQTASRKMASDLVDTKHSLPY